MCWMCEIDDKKPKFYLGRIYEVCVYKNGAIVGRGHCVVDDMYGAHEPMVKDLMGNPLTSNDYDNVSVSDDAPKFTFYNGSKH